jgi:hypothetical protein
MMMGKLNFIRYSTKGKNCFAAVSLRIVADLREYVSKVIELGGMEQKNILPQRTQRPQRKPLSFRWQVHSL